MKVRYFHAFVFFTFIASSLFSQKIDPPPPDKSVVYIVRPSFIGSAIKFSFFDSAKFIGQFRGSKYIRYECSPGRHLFWARAENRSFVGADLEAGKIYFLEADPTMGAIKARVDLMPFNPSHSAQMEVIITLLVSKPPVTYTEQQLEKKTKDLRKVIESGLAKYMEDQAKGKVNSFLEKSRYYRGGN